MNKNISFLEFVQKLGPRDFELHAAQINVIEKIIDLRNLHPERRMVGNHPVIFENRMPIDMMAAIGEGAHAAYIIFDELVKPEAEDGQT